MSPDGKWLLWGNNGVTGPSEYCVAALNGSAIRVWRNQPREKNSSIVWQADSRAWLLLVYDHSRPQHLDHVREYPLEAPYIPRTRSMQGLSIEPYMVGCLPGNRLLTNDDTGERYSIFTLEAPSTTVKQSRIRWTSTGDAGEALPSPQGTRLACCIVQPLSGLAAVIQRAFGGSDVEVLLLVSDLNGNGKRELGRFRSIIASHGGDHVGLCGWSADGKQLILQRNNDLWSIPIDD